MVFTGSVETGRKVAHACAERLSPCSLELGGKDAAIVLADANLERAAQGVAWGALTNAGQNCAAIERVYVEKSIAEPFTARVVEIVKGLRPGLDVGPLTTGAQRATVVRHVDAARDAGAKVLAGGAQGEGAGYAYAPTVVRVDDDTSSLVKDETFGPVIPIAVVEDVEEAVRRTNDSRYGLTAAPGPSALAAPRRSRGACASASSPQQPRLYRRAPGSAVERSRRDSYGITNSPLALDALTRPRFVLVDRSRAKRELWWFPCTETVQIIALAFAVLRSGTKGSSPRPRRSSP